MGLERLTSSSVIHTDLHKPKRFLSSSTYCDARIFKINMNNIDSLTPNFWMENIKCYELKQIMCQSDKQFINILNLC
jgi:hypothetical protein